jgi:hypothetical protein
MYQGSLIDELTWCVEQCEARLRENPPSEQEWRSFLNDGLPDGKEKQ